MTPVNLIWIWIPPKNAGLSKCVVEVGARPAWASSGGVGWRAIAGGRTMTISPDLVYMRLGNTKHHHGTACTCVPFRPLQRRLCTGKLKARKSLFTETWQKRPSSFELWAFENVTPSGIGSTIMIFIFTIFLIQTYIQINYYYDKNHANSTVITQYVEIALNNRSTVLCAVLLFCTGLEWFWVVVLYFGYMQI